jgi:hypothetical protein
MLKFQKDAILGHFWGIFSSFVKKGINTVIINGFSCYIIRKNFADCFTIRRNIKKYFKVILRDRSRSDIIAGRHNVIEILRFQWYFIRF